MHFRQFLAISILATGLSTTSFGDVKQGPHGGNGGNKSINEQMDFEGKIVEVFGREGSRLDQFGFRWKASNGAVTTKGPWGGNGGSSFAATTPSNERLVAVRVRSGGKVDAIELEYSNGTRKGPFGGTGGSWSPWMKLGGYEISGFHGKAGNEIDKLGVWLRPLAPVAAFSATPTSGTAPLKVAFNNSSSGVIESYSWTFGDGSTSGSKNPSHTYDPGSYTVKLTVTGPGGISTQTKSSYITVNHPKPTAKFSADKISGTAPLTVKFSNTSTNSTNYSWTFGDGGTSSSKNPTHVYGAPGTYDVWLKASGPGGSDTELKAKYVVVEPCAMNVIPSGCPITSLNGVDDYDHQNQVHKFGFTVFGAAPGDTIILLVGGSAAASLPGSSCYLLVSPTWFDTRVSNGFVDTFTYPIAASLLPQGFQFAVQAIHINANQEMDATNAVSVDC